MAPAGASDTVGSNAGPAGASSSAAAEPKAPGPPNGNGNGADSPASKSPRRRSTKRMSIMGGDTRRRTVFAPQARTMKTTSSSFMGEVFRLRHTIMGKILPQLTLAVFMGFVAQAAKLYFCETDRGQIEDPSQCWIAFEHQAHVSAGIILGLLLVTRTSLAYDRYYDGKAALGSIYNGLRNLNVASVAFMRMPREDEENYSPNSIDARRAQLAKDRVNIMRLSNLMFAFMRQAIREHRHGYSDTGPVEDDELLVKDRAGKPALPTLFESGAERIRYSKVDFNNRANVVASEICWIAETHRRMGHISERAALDVYHELELTLAAFKEAERIVTTPIPYQYLHMVNVIMFVYVFTTPFVFSVSYKWATPVVSFMVALAYYGVNAIGRCMEDPFNWEEPNHDLTSIGWRIYKENMKLHEMVDIMEKDMMLQIAPTEGTRAKQVFKMAGALRAAAHTGGTGRGASGNQKLVGASGLLQAVEQAQALNEGDEEEDDPVEVKVGKEFGEGTWSFITELWAWENTVWPSLLPQVILSGIMGAVAWQLKVSVCEKDGTEVYDPSECLITFDRNAHDLVGIAIGFLIVFRVSMAYGRYYEGKEVVGQLYEGVRNLNVAFATFMRVPEPGELDYKNDVNDDYRQALSEDRLEVLRLSNLLYAFIRQAVREQRQGYPGVGLVSDEEIVTRDRRGKPSVPLLMRDEERYEFLTFTPPNRPNIIVARIQSIVEHHRRVGHMCERAAFEIFHQSEEVLGAFRAAERIAVTPFPFVYMQTLNLLLFFFVFSSGFMFSYTFKWITPLPCIILAMGFYGLNEIARALQDPFSWDEPMHDLSLVGWRIYRENLAIHHWVDSLEKTGRRATNARRTKLYEVLTQAMDAHEKEDQATGMSTAAQASEQATGKRGRRRSVMEKERRSNDARRGSLQAAKLDAPMPNSGQGQWSFLVDVFKFKRTVLAKLVVHISLGVALAFLAQFLKISMCDPVCSMTCLDPDVCAAGKADNPGIPGHTAYYNQLADCVLANPPTAIAGVAVGDLALGDALEWPADELREAATAAIPFCAGRPEYPALADIAMVPVPASASGAGIELLTQAVVGLPDSVNTLAALRDVGISEMLWTPCYSCSNIVTESSCSNLGREEDRQRLVDITNTLAWVDRADDSPPISLADVSSGADPVVADGVKIAMCPWACCVEECNDPEVDADCFLTLSSVAHLVITGVLAFLLAFRTNIAYYRYYEGKKFLGMLLNAVRNVNVACVAFVRAPREGEEGFEARKEVREELSKELNRDRIELRRLSNVLYGFIRQAIREQRAGYPDMPNVTDNQLVDEDKMGKPSLGVLLSDEEKTMYKTFDFNNRPNVVVCEMQTIVERHRRLGNVSERGAFDIYHDLEMGLEAFKNCERIVSTKMPYQYMHMLNLLLFLFAFSTPMVYSSNYKWITFLPVMITVIAFYGIAEIGYAIEDPFDWKEPMHDMSGAGQRTYLETLQVHEVGDIVPRTEPVQGDFDVRVAGAPHAPVNVDNKVQLIKNTQSRGSFSMSSGDDILNMYDDVPHDINHSVFGFIVELFSVRHTVWSRVIFQVLAAGLVGLGAQFAKLHVCGHGVKHATDCDITFDIEAHAVLGTVLGYMLVFRTNLAYERFYEGKQSVGQLHIALRNLNVGIIAFIRPPVKGEQAYEEGPARSRLAQALRDKRSEMLRLTHVLFAFMRQAVREQRIGYPENQEITDKELLTGDKFGKPSLATLLSPSEVSYFTKVPFHNRPNVVVTKLQAEVEAVRRMPHVLCDRGAFDLYHECELVLDAFKSCERVVSTPIPYQYLHMVNFVTFCFVFSVPFALTYTWKWLTPAPAMVLALTFYGIGKIGESIERPFNWTVPNHDMTGLGWRIYRECMQLHKRFNKREEVELQAAGSAMALRAVELEWSVAATAVGGVAAAKHKGHDPQLRRRASLVAQGHAPDLVDLKGWPLHNWTFITELVTKKETVLVRVLPQMVLAGLAGLIANFAKNIICHENVINDNECFVTFGNVAHVIAGSIVGFLLVFRVNLAYLKFYEAKEALGLVYDGLRNVMVATSAFMRESKEGERNHREHTPEQVAKLHADLVEILRLTNLLYAFIRQAVREQRHGYPRKSFVSDSDLLDADKFGSPCVPDLLTPEERAYFKDVDFNNRPNLVMAKIQVMVERNRRLGFIYEKSAFDIYHECETVLGAFKTCEKITTTPVPYQYLHMLNFLLFFYVYTSPLVFSATFKWITPFPSVIVAMGFYGIAEIGQVIEESFDWEEPKHDLSGLGRRILNENKLILKVRDEPPLRKGAGPVTEGFMGTDHVQAIDVNES